MGRQREFDVDQALDAALCVFWRKGYEGASYTDLTQATGVERPALYSAFGNKESLFRLALDRYYDKYLGFVPDSIEKQTSREVATRMLRGTVDLCTKYSDHRGCLGIQGALACSDGAEPIRCALVEARASVQTMLRERFEKAKEDGDLPDSADCAALAAFICTMTYGIAVQAKAGAPREALDAVVDQALLSWPAA